jgi:uncharacterized protein YcbK (DUF882 family)
VINEISRRALLGGLIGLVGAAATPALAKAPAILKGAGDYRRLSLVNEKTGEWVNSVYWIEGEYIPEALQGLNYLLRDWRQEKVCRMDPRAIDILAAAQHLLDSSEPFEVVSGYRTKQTNAMLRKRSRGVASSSYHIKGMAVDIAMKSRSVSQICRAGLALGAGGVGKYSRSQFVHLDSGPARNWGR